VNRLLSHCCLFFYLLQYTDDTLHANSYDNNDENKRKDTSINEPRRHAVEMYFSAILAITHLYAYDPDQDCIRLMQLCARWSSRVEQFTSEHSLCVRSSADFCREFCVYALYKSTID